MALAAKGEKKYFNQIKKGDFAIRNDFCKRLAKSEKKILTLPLVNYQSIY